MIFASRLVASFLLSCMVCSTFFLDYNFANAQPVVNDPNIKIEPVYEGIDFPTSMAFLGPDDILVLEKEKGTVQRIVNGQMLDKPLLDVNVATKSERGMLGIAIAKSQANTYVFLYFTESKSEDGDDESKEIDPIGNRLYRYELVNNELINPKLLIDIPASPGHHHQGGVVLIGPDGNIYLSTGDVDHNTEAQNIVDGPEADGTSGILRITQDGQIVNGRGILGDEHPLDMYYAYGIRNSFGIDFDPVTGNLWNTENGPWFGDEINLVDPGFNSGWSKIQGIWEPKGQEKGDVFEELEGLVEFDGKGKYSSPEFIWDTSVGPSAIKFFNSNAFGEEYKNDLLVGIVNEQAIYHFELNDRRTGLELLIPLNDNIANRENVRPYKLAEGLGGITDIEVGPDGYLYVLSHHWNRESEKASGTISRLIPSDSPP